jgi:hypothetical protein
MAEYKYPTYGARRKDYLLTDPDYLRAQAAMERVPTGPATGGWPDAIGRVGTSFLAGRAMRDAQGRWEKAEKARDKYILDYYQRQNELREKSRFDDRTQMLAWLLGTEGIDDTAYASRPYGPSTPLHQKPRFGGRGS